MCSGTLTYLHAGTNFIGNQKYRVRMCQAQVWQKLADQLHSFCFKLPYLAIYKAAKVATSCCQIVINM